jgi:uncharacterized protein
VDRDVSADLGCEAFLALPDEGEPASAVLVLSGSSGRVEHSRCRILAEAGVAALSIRWFGGQGQLPGICELPLETFTPAIDLLSRLAGRVVLMGVSKGAEAALLLGVHDPRIGGIAAFAPTSVVWANVGPGADGRGADGDEEQYSSWSLGGEPLPFVSYAEDWEPATDPPAFRELYRVSMLTYAAAIPAATIPVERIQADVLLVAGGDDRLWPATDFAAAIVERRWAHGLATSLVTSPGAGHRTLLPGEVPPPPSRSAHGGTAEADAELGRRGWPELTSLLRIAHQE